MAFKVGDRVKHDEFGKGTVVEKAKLGRTGKNESK